jgi:hypothetical protein
MSLPFPPPLRLRAVRQGPDRCSGITGRRGLTTSRVCSCDGKPHPPARSEARDSAVPPPTADARGRWETTSPPWRPPSAPPSGRGGCITQASLQHNAQIVFDFPMEGGTGEGIRSNCSHIRPMVEIDPSSQLLHTAVLGPVRRGALGRKRGAPERRGLGTRMSTAAPLLLHGGARDLRRCAACSGAVRRSSSLHQRAVCT